MLRQLLRDESGQTLTEYGLIMVLAVIVVIVGIVVYQNALLDKYNEINNTISNHIH